MDYLLSRENKCQFVEQSQIELGRSRKYAELTYLQQSSRGRDKVQNLLYDKPIDELHNQVVNMEIPSYVEGILSFMVNINNKEFFYITISDI